MVEGQEGTSVLTALLDLLLRRGVHEPNLFRTTRSIEDVRGLWSSLAALEGSEGELHRRLSEEPDIHLVSAVVMHHLKVTACLIPTRLYDAVMEADLSSEDEEILAVGLRCLLQSVPRAEWKHLKALVRFLGHVAQSAHLNELPVQSLAFLFAPLLTRPEGSAYMSVRHLQVGRGRGVQTTIYTFTQLLRAPTRAHTRQQALHPIRHL